MSAVLSSASTSAASVGQTRAQSNKAAAPKKVSPLSFGMVTKVKDGGEYSEQVTGPDPNQTVSNSLFYSFPT